MQGTQSPDTKVNLAKEPALCQDTAALYGWTQTHTNDQHEERVYVQHGVLYKHGWTFLSSAVVRHQLQFGRRNSVGLL